MLINDVKDGMQLRLTQGRKGTMKDNGRGIARVVEVEVPGQGFDVGSTYIDEIVYVKKNKEADWEEVVILESHRKKLNNIRVVW